MSSLNCSARVFDIEPDMFGRLGRCCHHADATRRFELMPGILGHDQHHASREGHGLPALVCDHVQSSGAIDYLHDLVALRMAFPRALTGKLDEEYRTVSIWSHTQTTFPALFVRRGRRAPLEHRELGEFGLEINDVCHSVLQGS